MISMIPGVVMAIYNDGDRHAVIISCHLPDKRKLEIDVRASCVPGDLRYYGCPVWITYDDKGLVIKKRTELEVLKQPDDIAEIERWLNEIE